MGRRFVGIELKASYFQQAVGNMHAAMQTQSLFAWGAELRDADAP
jgi:hypothetical protein